MTVCPVKSLQMKTWWWRVQMHRCIYWQPLRVKSCDVVFDNAFRWCTRHNNASSQNLHLHISQTFSNGTLRAPAFCTPKLIGSIPAPRVAFTFHCARWWNDHKRFPKLWRGLSVVRRVGRQRGWVSPALRGGRSEMKVMDDQAGAFIHQMTLVWRTNVMMTCVDKLARGASQSNPLRATWNFLSVK